MPDVPGVKIISVGMPTGVAIRVFSPNSICRGISFGAPIPDTTDRFIFGTTRHRQTSPLGMFGTLRDDVDHPVHRVSAPQRASGSSDHLDPIDIPQDIVL